RYGVTSNVIAPIAASRMTQDYMGPLAEIADPDVVAPMVVYLASRDCSVTHEIFSAGGGRFARVFIGLTPGWTAPRGTRPSLEDIREHLDEIRDETGYLVPDTSAAEGEILAKLLEGTAPNDSKERGRAAGLTPGRAVS